MTRREIKTSSAPTPGYAFSQGVRDGRLIQVSGQGSMDPATGRLVHEDDVEAQTERTLANIEAVLAAGGATFDDVVMLRVYLTVRESFAPMNAAYARFLSTRVSSGVMPARTTVMTGLPVEGMLVEIDALAAVPQN